MLLLNKGGNMSCYHDSEDLKKLGELKTLAPAEFKGFVALDAIVGRDTLLGLKPAPDMLIRALEIFSVDRSVAAFVGDSDADIRAAQSCGVRFYGIAATDSARDRLLAAGATEIFGSPAALAIHLNLVAARSR